MPIALVDYNMPVPFIMKSGSTNEATVLRPDRKRNLRRRRMESFHMACVGSHFIAPVIAHQQNISELMVRCLNTTYVRYDGEDFQFDDFRCKSIPKSTLRLTNERCQDIHHRVAEIGFQTKNYFLKLYSSCFEMEKKNVLFSWYLVDCPMYKYRQAAKVLGNFKKPELFDNVDPIGAYGDQMITLGHIVNSTNLTRTLPRRVIHTRYFLPGQLTTKSAFVYTFEQHATNYYENTTPQWSIFKNDLWSHLEMIFKEITSTSFTKHVIVTGTYGKFKLPNESNVEQSLYIGPNKTMVIPRYVWKMDYDLRRRTGLVYIGLNNPYKKVDKDDHFCEAVPCPNLESRLIDRQLLFCCTKDSFELTFGKIDTTVYREIEFLF